MFQFANRTVCSVLNINHSFQDTHSEVGDAQMKLLAF